MFDLFGKIVGGLTSLAQEKLAFDFLKSDPGMALFAGGLLVVLAIVLPIGPEWMRTVSWIGKGLAGVGTLAMLFGVCIVGIDYAIAKAAQLKKVSVGVPTSSQKSSPALNLPRSADNNPPSG